MNHRPAKPEERICGRMRLRWIYFGYVPFSMRILLKNVSLKLSFDIALVEHFEFFSEKIGERLEFFITYFFSEKTGEKCKSILTFFDSK
jgi:hypothetical protein